MSADEATGTPERAGTGTPIDDLAAVADEAGPAATHVAWKPVAIGIAATLAAVAWNRIGRVRAERAGRLGRQLREHLGALERAHGAGDFDDLPYGSGHDGRSFSCTILPV